MGVFIGGGAIASSLLVLFLCACTADAQLRPNFYGGRCPNLEGIVRGAMRTAVSSDPRLPASIIRLFFHDCFVNGCDASVLLADTPTFTGEQNAFPNRNSLRGLDVIETIKAAVEAACNATVSCADILALATRDGAVLSGGPTWRVPLGRRDATTASQSAANSNLPGASSSLSVLLNSFANQGLNLRDLVALSGAHTFGLARCVTFRNRIYNDANIDPAFAAARRATCPQAGGAGDPAPLDVTTPNAFDNAYYANLLSRRGLLHSDQELFNNGSADSIVRSYANNGAIFFRDFAASMVKMGNIAPLTGSNGDIRRVCSRVN
ncbi:peroxidase P7-like [Wolffia australiana]